jgi:hypothetical protein
MAGLAQQTNLLAQGKLVDGYIITNQNDTIRGLIKDEGWKESPRLVHFKGLAGILKQKFSAADIKEFSILSTKEIYKSKKIGLLDITLTRAYTTVPSMETKDSVQLFLQEIVAGKKASLYLYLDALERFHYFVEKENLLKELYNYPFHKKIDNKTYLLIYDEYKNQLTQLSKDANGFNDTIPLYQETYLKRYIERYNRSFPDKREIYKAKDKKLIYDLDINIGLENWNERPVILGNELTYGIGLRINFPRKFQNRYLKMSFFLTPNVLIGYDQNSYRKTSLKTFEIAVGSHIGAGKVRPYLGFIYSGIYGGYREDFLGFQAGISYKRRINLEIGHFANFYSVVTETSFLTAPRISLHYMINLNQ